MLETHDCYCRCCKKTCRAIWHCRNNLDSTQWNCRIYSREGHNTAQPVSWDIASDYVDRVNYFFPSNSPICELRCHKYTLTELIVCRCMGRQPQVEMRAGGRCGRKFARASALTLGQCTPDHTRLIIPWRGVRYGAGRSGLFVLV